MPRVEFAFIVEGSPFSVNIANKQTKKHREWKDRVRATAHAQWIQERRTDPLPTSELLEVEITTFFTEVEKDVDNVIKPILDGMKLPEQQRRSLLQPSVFALYRDDKNVVKVTSAKINLRSPASVQKPDQMLADALAKYEEFVYIRLIWGKSED